MKYAGYKYNMDKTTNAVFAVCLFVCVFLSVGTKAQLFGGGIKSSNKTVIPATITLAQDQMYFIASVYDQNYLPYTAPTALATTDTNVNPDGITESPTLNVQGSISILGVTVYIPVTTTGSGTLPAYTTSVNIPASLTENGLARTLTLSWASQAYTSSTKTITAMLRTVSGTLNAKKLDINAGIGNDYLGVLLGSFSYPYNNAGNITTYQVRDIPGIPDRMFGKYDLGSATTYEHNFLYVPVMGEDSKIWLSNNLGADYANLSSSSFSLATQATASDDYLAYGSMFQWGRCPDGHELISWITAGSGSPKYSAVWGQSATNTPTSVNFLMCSYDWRNPQNDILWATEASGNNPCPSGFRVPTDAELVSLITAAGISDLTTAAASKLKFSASGTRSSNNGTIAYTSAHGHYWSSSVWNETATVRNFDDGVTYTNTIFRGNGYAVRCLKDESVAGTISSLSCTPTDAGTLTQGTAATGVSSTFSYTGGNGGVYAPQSIASTGVTGLTATLESNYFASGAGTLTYTITGTPSASGTASFAISIGGQSCTLTRTVALPAAALTTLDCAGATHNGTLTQGTAASGVSSAVAYTGGNGGTYALQTVTSTDVTGLTATLSAGTLASGAGTLTYTITGTPSASGTASFAISIGGQSCTLTRTVYGTITSIDCSGATNNGTLYRGIAASGVSSTISYTGGNGGAYNGQTLSSTGVTGLTATLAAGNFASGAGTLTYTITGTPSASGTASFAISIGGQSCTLTRTVSTFTIPASITLAQDQIYFIASVYDTDYLPYTTPTTAASTATVAADGTTESVTVNVQGSITTTGVTVYILVTATGSSTLPAYSATVTVPANLTEDGISRDLTLSWAAQAYTSSTKTITATLKAVGGTLNAKKLDINAGIGNDYLGYLLGAFTYPYNSTGATTSYSVRDIPGIPDKMFGLTDNSGTVEHNMLYLPVVAEDGKTWLNNNLGAHYADLNSAYFNITQQATAYNDWKAYGSLFQWGRKPDGHELMTWTSSTAGTAKYSAVSGQSATDTPTSANFLSGSTDWRSTQNDNLWQGEAGTNNPCPSGFRLPTSAEQTALVTAAGITGSATASSSKLKFSVPGGRYYNNGALSDAGYSGYCWSSSVSGTSAYSRYFSSGSTRTNSSSRTYGFSVRCLKN